MNAPGATPQTTPEASLLTLLRGLLEDSRPGRAPPAPTLGSRLDRDLGLDSLGRVELGLRIERAMNVRLPDDALATAETVADLLSAITGSRVPAASLGPAQERAGEPHAASLPMQAATLIETLDWHVRHAPARTHVRFLAGDDRSELLTHADLDQRARRVAQALVRAGVAARDACALMLPSGLEFFVVYFGILMAGAVPVPLYPPQRLTQIEEHLRRQGGILANCRATALVTVPEARRLARWLRADVPSLRHVVTPEELEREPATAAFQPCAAAPGDVAVLQYTSGSTGDPKGVVLTHANLVANVRAMGRAAGAGPDDVFVSWLPLYHDMGLIGAWLASLYFGVQLVLMSPLSFLSRPVRWLQAIHDYRGTISAAPNFAYELCATRVAEVDTASLDLSSWRWAFNGAEPVSADTLARFSARYARNGFDAAALAPVYGLAECALAVSFPQGRRGVRVDAIDREALMYTGRADPITAGHARALALVACGTALPDYALRIADERGRELPDRVQGRIEFRGPSATSGYFDNPDATARLRDGVWLDSGDLGYLVAGELYVTGRARDVIIRAGHNVYPYELEVAVGGVPGVRRGCVAVFGAPDASGTERLIVVAETREGDVARREAMVASINALARDLTGAAADEVVLAPPYAVLKTSSGKIRRAATRAAWLQGTLGASAGSVLRQILRLAGRSGRARLRRVWAGFRARAYSAWAWLAFGLVAGVALCGTVLVPGRSRRRRVAHVLARLLAFAVGIRLEVHGLKHLQHDRTCIIASNHASYLDALVLLAVLPPRQAYVAKAEFRAQPLMRHVLASVGAQYVERFDPARGVEDTRALAVLAAQGESLVFFPEGTFVSTPGLLAFRMGAFLLAVQQGLEVVPVALEGTRTLLPSGTWRPRPGRVRVTVGAPLVPRGSDWSAAVELRDAARQVVLQYCGEPDAAV